MANLREIKKAFFELSDKEQESILKEIYSFSKDIKEFLNVRLLNDGEELYIEKIRKATESSTPMGLPKTIKVTQVNSILNKAKKSKQLFTPPKRQNTPQSYELKIQIHLNLFFERYPQ